MKIIKLYQKSELNGKCEVLYNNIKDEDVARELFVDVLNKTIENMLYDVYIANIDTKSDEEIEKEWDENYNYSKKMTIDEALRNKECSFDVFKIMLLDDDVSVSSPNNIGYHSFYRLDFYDKKM